MNSIPITIDLIGLGSASDEVWLIFRYEKKTGFPCSTSGPLAQHPFLPSFALPSFFFCRSGSIGCAGLWARWSKKTPKWVSLRFFHCSFMAYATTEFLLPSICYRVFRVDSDWLANGFPCAASFRLIGFEMIPFFLLTSN